MTTNKTYFECLYSLITADYLSDYLASFLNHPQHEDLDHTIYVRNEGITSDYEITIVENGYAKERR